jgi:hypothetical protein
MSVPAPRIFVTQPIPEKPPARLREVGSVEFNAESAHGRKKGDILLFLAKSVSTRHNRGMPRTARASVGEMCYHVINRGNARQEIFLKKGDYQAFIELIGRASERVRMRLLA